MSNQPQVYSGPPPLVSSAGRLFIAPDWREPLDRDAVIANIPKDAQLSGMFFLALQARAKQLNVALPGMRERYLQFQFYPLAEFIPPLLEGAKRFYPSQSLRESLRTMGRAVPKALVASTLGRVVFGSAEGIHDAVIAMAKTYAINLRPSRAEVTQLAANWLVVQLEGVHYLLDSHHFGVFEGTMLHAGVQGTVQVAAASSSAAELLLTW